MFIFNFVLICKEVIKMKYWLVIKDTENKRTWWKYFESESDMDLYIRRIKYVKNLLLIEDSRDIIYI